MPQTERSLTKTVGFIGITAGVAMNFAKRIDPYILGQGTFLENHIGNFNASQALFHLNRFLITSLEIISTPIESTEMFRLTNSQRNALTVVSVTLINVLVENLSKPNPEFLGDVAVGTISAILASMAFPKIKDSK
ncbi:TPA: hypothetical protein DEQ95_03955 [Candidatus Beckwithbacteria bacterium]|nr:MAG: hypothetical protein UY43_C0001G0194 [Candidatus Beckwithbacteria bacterium GW2011_GWC1_49_16]OGD48589.1 MAG: hypothetical protein A2877_02480 [Candidatus Beckwithbacteria bacterium RIFCSPHIGHO2_01_FULL_49_39]OGD51507.1 MAG: hypothetical protein A3K56_04730 [Candidatus Beckwithbacteria bacterium RIFCSPHIGHO2_12_FULL_49_13]OGD52044.1 MAG: hypothetical protein A3D86_01785 [Candidatus Beckwithbacteria bacterium RIFCSPHIGHO2_02_FULL_49_13]OGD58380.1 MAG: hypothetical protein A3J22_01395 [Ca